MKTNKSLDEKIREETALDKVRAEIEGRDGVYCKNCVAELKIQDVVTRKAGTKAGTPRENYTPLYNCENWTP